MNRKRKALALLGPTASGKTAAVLALAAEFPIEIISLDSALIYRDMDIGTAKPSREEMAAVPHHLIDIISPLESYNAAEFVSDCNRLIGEITARGRIPVITGGTMMYYRALIGGLSPLPSADPDVRQKMAEEKALFGADFLFRELQRVDAVSAARLHAGDSQRIERALEIFRITGRRASDILQSSPPSADTPSVYTATLLPGERGMLHQKIEKRFSNMLENGFLKEVETLRRRYPTLHADLPSMRCVGYRQAWDYLNGDIGFGDFVGKSVAATRQLAKRQLTWLRKLPADLCLESAQKPEQLAERLALVVEQEWKVAE